MTDNPVEAAMKIDECFALYKEKIVDYDFMYSVDIVNLFDTVYKNLENKEHIKDIDIGFE